MPIYFYILKYKCEFVPLQKVRGSPKHFMFLQFHNIFQTKVLDKVKLRPMELFVIQEEVVPINNEDVVSQTVCTLGHF